ncbi:MAG TPA: hypothetical protein VLN74_03305, partial [Ilumatobacteraceae bacterium]|nr:hypothetical protein [Ilumatobacteraceae bacterium]
MTEAGSPFEQLAATTDERVDPVFAARLRARVQRALGSTPERITIELPTRTRAGSDDLTTDPATDPATGPATDPATDPTTEPATDPAKSQAAATDPRTERSTTMSEVTRAQVITPYLCVHDANAALDWYREY